MGRRGRILVIFNPASGTSQNRGKEALASIHQAMHRQDLEYDLRITTRQGHAAGIVRSVSPSRYGTVCVAGGDGTINEVVNGLFGKRIRLGILPLGTVNVLAIQLKIPFGIRQAVEVIARNRCKRIDLVTADNRLFVLMAGIGFDAYTIYKTDLGMKRFLGKLAYLLSAIRALLKRRPKRMDVLIDGRISENAYFMMVSNVSLYGGRIPLFPQARMDDGCFDVLLFKNRDNFSLIRYLAAFITGRSRSIPFVTAFQAKRLEVKSRENVLVHTDAELSGTLPMTFSVIPRAIEVVVP